jgi:hypothetical protein
MDKLSRYRSAIKQHIMHLAELSTRSPTPGIESFCAFDEARDQYLLLSAGWSGDRRVRGTTAYVRLRDGKIWIEEDWTENGIATGLLKSGVPKEDIVLAFHPPSMRKLTEFAVA